MAALSGQGLPPALKPIATYLQRAKEIAPKDAIVAYYTRLYAMQLALDLRSKMAKEDMPVLFELMDAMEGEKQKTDLAAVEVPSVHVENFAQDLFIRADELDRQGTSDMRVARAFYAASVVIDVCRQFGELPADLQEKHKYARWRFVEISKASKEGRPPAPPPDVSGDDLFGGQAGGGGGEDGGGLGDGAAGAADSAQGAAGGEAPPPQPPSAGGSGGAFAPTPPAVPPQQPPPPAAPPAYHHPPPAMPPPPPAAYVPPTVPHHAQPPAPQSAPPPQPLSAPVPPPTPAAVPHADSLFAAQRHAKFAVSALQFSDVPTAVQNLQAALALLTAPPPAGTAI